MNKAVFTFFLVLSIAVESQNLVPNSSFEDYMVCPDQPGQLSLSVGWFTPFFFSSTDYFNKCNTNMFSIPINNVGYQSSNTGNAYIGFSPFGEIIDFREYFSIKLRNSLTTNKRYEISFFINLADSSKYSVSKNDIAIYFSEDSISMPQSHRSNPLPYTPQLTAGSENEFLVDTVNWVELTFSYIALGGEEFVNIGNFNDDANTSWQLFNNNTNVSAAYYYIDDVSLIRLLNRDLGITAIFKDTLCYSPEDEISVSIRNEGVDTLDFTAKPLTIQLEVRLGNTVVETVNREIDHNQFNPQEGQGLLPDSSLQLAVSPLDFSQLSDTHQVRISISFSGDEDSSNNVLDTLIIPELSVGSPHLSEVSLCVGDSIKLNADNVQGRLAWQYSKDGMQWEELTTFASYTDQPLSDQYYRLEVCGWLHSDPFMVEVLHPQIESERLELCPSGVHELNAKVSEEVEIVNWYADSSATTMVHQGFRYETEIDSSTTYYLQAIIDSCIATAELKIILSGCELEIPNIFSPNGDGINDVFFYGNAEGKNIETKIFNRWGEKVAEWNGNKGWDGNGVREGVYYYFIKTDDEVHKGTITLVR